MDLTALAATVGEALQRRGLLLATAESCTPAAGWRKRGRRWSAVPSGSIAVSSPTVMPRRARCWGCVAPRSRPTALSAKPQYVKWWRARWRTAVLAAVRAAGMAGNGVYHDRVGAGRAGRQLCAAPELGFDRREQYIGIAICGIIAYL